MAYSNEYVAQALKEARLNKGLSQRAFSQRVGIPQSHLSRIESGAVKPQLTSLIELARALDLEVMLVPRRIVPVVEGIIRGETASQAEPAPTALVTGNLQQLVTEATAALKIYPSLTMLNVLASIANELKIYRLRSQDTQVVQGALRDIKTFRRMAEARAGQPLEPEETAHLNKARDSLRQLRSMYVHGRGLHVEEPNRSKPAYSLEEGDDDA